MALYKNCRSLLWCIYICAVCRTVGGRPATDPATNAANSPSAAVPPPTKNPPGPSLPASGIRAPSFAVLQGQTNGLPHTVQQRLPVQILQKNDQQWHLYLLALNRFQDMDQSQKLGYYQVAGIHGRPFVPWDNVSPAPGQENSGYATHSSTLFPVWHRAYLALFEQVLYGIVQEVASGFNLPQYTAAANTFRIPYWDWAAPGAPYLPDTVGGSPYINIVLPNGTETIRNPLYQYDFHGGNLGELGGAPFNAWQITLRDPTSQDGNASSQNSEVDKLLKTAQSSYRQTFLQLLQSYPSYWNFSNQAWIPQNSQYSSLESLHDDIHGVVGGRNLGHMNILDVAAFDPIFWLHHANVDRLFAIWQAIYPNSYIERTETTSSNTSYTIQPNQWEDQDSSLTPFRTDNGGFFTPGAVRSTAVAFNYVYPETQNTDPAVVRKAVNDLYGSIIASTKPPRHRKRSPNPPSSGLATFIERGFSSNPAGPYGSPRKNDPSIYHEWIVNIRAPRDAVDSTYFIHIFLGDFGPSPDCWFTDPNLVGTRTILYRNPDPNTNTNTLVTGTVPLTIALNNAAQKAEIDQNDVPALQTYLSQNLHWRISKGGGGEIPKNEIEGLRISVVSSEVKPAEKDDEFPTWGSLEVHRQVTHGRAGGLCDGEEA